ncbi:MAG: hypothetical protein M1829_000596 [Trizodia sp. TS-e1964]|nr:MAG: hypothetical protein M1829_000596 [Trizodia sp. TS-e1964]
MSLPTEKAGHQLPIRTATAETSTSEEAIPTNDPNDVSWNLKFLLAHSPMLTCVCCQTSLILLERLQAWKHACGYLEGYISATEKMQRANAKECERILKTLSDPLREGQHFDQALGGLAGLFENIRFNTQGMANAHLETEKSIRASVLPILERLHTEIKHKSKELGGGAAKGSKAVDKSRNTTQKHIEMLGESTAGFESTGGKPDPNMDPYIVQRGVYHRLHKQILDENVNHQDLLAVQSAFQAFEAHIVETLQSALASFTQHVAGQAQHTKAMYEDILGTAQRIPGDFEWRGFVKRNPSALLDPHAHPRNINTITFPNQNHKSTQPLIEGTLERKGKVMKSYSSGYYVVTPSKFLHEFKDDDNFRRDPVPENSLFLPNCNVGSVSGLEFHVKGKDTSKGLMGSKLSMNREYSFKAHSAEDALKWWSIISSIAGHSPAVGGSSALASSPTSPVQQHVGTGSEPPAYGAEKAPTPPVSPHATSQQQQGVVGTNSAKPVPDPSA